MNDYGFDYLNYITNVPNNMNLIKNNPMNMKMKTQSQLVEPDLGFIRGNIFADQYDPY